MAGTPTHCEKTQLRWVISNIPECFGSGEGGEGREEGEKHSSVEAGGGLGSHLGLTISRLSLHTHMEMTDERKHKEAKNTQKHKCEGRLTHTLVHKLPVPHCGPALKHTGRRCEVMTAGFWLWNPSSVSDLFKTLSKAPARSRLSRLCRLLGSHQAQANLLGKQPV